MAKAPGTDMAKAPGTDIFKLHPEHDRKEILSRPISDLDLPGNVQQELLNYPTIKTVGDLAICTVADLSEIGYNAIGDIKNTLNRLGIELQQNKEGKPRQLPMNHGTDQSQQPDPGHSRLPIDHAVLHTKYTSDTQTDKSHVKRSSHTAPNIKPPPSGRLTMRDDPHLPEGGKPPQRQK